MKKAIYISIKPQYTKRIETEEKNYEFRKYIPKESIDTLFVYETTPTCKLKYVIELGEIIKYPEQLSKPGYGNDDFNKGAKEAKYAYEIKHVYMLKKALSLAELKNNYGFTPPQSYAYDQRYENLTKYINTADKVKII